MASKKEESPASYMDCKIVMDEALKRDGLMYECANAGKATYFIQRCHKYRNLLRSIAQEESDLIPGYRASSAYDILVIRKGFYRAGEFTSHREGNVVRFEQHRPEGQMIDPETGEPITPDGFNISELFNE